MKRLLKNKLFTNTIIFTLSSILSKGINFLLLPILTYYLTKDDYGYLGYIVSIVSITSIYIGLWPQNFIMTKYYAYKKELLSKYISNLFIIIIITFLFVLSILLVFQDNIFEDFTNKTQITFLVTFYTLFIVIFNIHNILAEIEKKAIRFAIFQLLYIGGSLSLALYLIIQLHFGWKGKFYAELLFLFFIAVYTIYYLIRYNYLTFDFDKKKIFEIISFLFPLTFSVVSLYLITTMDKIILAKYLDMKQVGLYTIAMTMSVVINIVFESIMRAWSPYFFEKIENKTRENIIFLRKSLLYYSIFVIFTSIVYTIVIPYIFSIMIDKKFIFALNLIPFIIIAFTFEGLRKPLVGFLMHKNKVQALAYISFIAGILNILLNIYLIKYFGIYGAIYASIASFGFLYLTSLFLVYKECIVFKSLQP